MGQLATEIRFLSSTPQDCIFLYIVGLNVRLVLCYKGVTR